MYKRIMITTIMFDTSQYEEWIIIGFQLMPGACIFSKNTPSAGSLKQTDTCKYSRVYTS